jgi:phage baseplate assembly protein W
MPKFKFKSSGVNVDNVELKTIVESRPIGVATPLSLGSGRSGLFEMNFDPVEQISDNLRNLILTNAGERLGNYYYGANLKPITTEYSSMEDFENAAMTRILNAVNQFLPIVDLDSFSVSRVQEDDGNADRGLLRIDMTVKYNIPQLRIGGKVLNVSMYVI